MSQNQAAMNQPGGSRLETVNQCAAQQLTALDTKGHPDTNFRSALRNDMRKNAEQADGGQ